MSEHPFQQPLENEAGAPPKKERIEPAPLLPRFSAFCADMAVIIFLFITVVYVFLPRLYPTESQALEEYREQVTQYHEEARRASAQGEEPPPQPEPGDDVLRYGNILHMSLLGILFLYFFLGEKFTRGSSPGKMIFRLRVVLREAPDRPLPGIVSAIRSLAKTAFFIIPPLIILYAFAFFQPQRRALHDLLARTILIKVEAPKRGPSEETDGPPQDPPLRTP